MVAELEGRWRVASLCSESMGVDGLNWLPLKSIPHSEECDMPLQTLTQSRSLSVGALWRKSFSVAGSLAARHVSLVVNGGNKVTTLSAKPVFFLFVLGNGCGEDPAQTTSQHTVPQLDSFKERLDTSFVEWRRARKATRRQSEMSSNSKAQLPSRYPFRSRRGQLSCMG